MKKRLTLKKDYEIKLNSRISKYIAPKYVYLPIAEKDTIKTDIVMKEMAITNNISSPVSGKIVGTKYCQTATGEVKKCIAILNDYKETIPKRKASLKNLNNVSFEKMLVDLKEYQKEQLFQLLSTLESNQTIILNGIEEEPYVANEIFINKEYASSILEMLDALRIQKEAKEIKIILKDNDRENIEVYENLIGTYPDIEILLVPDEYLISYTPFLKQYLNLPSNSFFLKPSQVLEMFQTIKRHRTKSEHLFTISGNGIENPQIVEAKIGTPVKEILEELIKYRNKPINHYINGLMRGKKMEIGNLIVTEELKSILIMEDEEILEKDCINCGKCVSICPVQCNPKMTYETKNKKYSENCIDCGLCSYICPSNINLRRDLKEELERPGLHFTKENNYLMYVLFALLPLIFYGFYKNGILPLLNQDTSFLKIFSPLLFPILGIGIGLLVDYIIWWKSNSENIWTSTPIYGLIISMTLPINANVFVVGILLFFLLYGTRLLEKKKIKINPFWISKGIISILLSILAGVSFANASELQSLHYSIIDIFFGRDVGGICTTSIFFIIISYIFLSFTHFYKKEIPLYIIGTYIILSFAFELILPSGDLLKTILNSSIFFGSVFVATDINHTPYTERGILLYSISCGILAFLFTRFLSSTEGIYLSLLFIGFFVPIFDIIALKRKEKKRNFVEFLNQEK